YTWDRLGGFGTAPDLDLTTLNYGRQFIARPAFSLAVHQVQDQVGVYLQEQAKWDRFILTLTGRHDWVSQTSASGTPG
ncbi:TonB-dependent receptor domain-containing protein, partial [Klebsiella pneumoniae]